jgi:hypothetical protein
MGHKQECGERTDRVSRTPRFGMVRVHGSDLTMCARSVSVSQPTHGLSALTHGWSRRGFSRLRSMPILIITEKTSQARDLRAALGDRFGQILPAEGPIGRRYWMRLSGGALINMMNTSEHRYCDDLSSLSAS